LPDETDKIYKTINQENRSFCRG